MHTLDDRPLGTSGSTTMRAATRRTYGSTDALEVTAVARPTPGPDEVLVEVAAAGLDRGVWHVMTGKPYVMRLMGFGVRRPKDPVLGMDVAGRVVGVGADVTRFAVGDSVFGIGTGTFAELAVAKESKLVLTPENVTVEQAAVSAISGITALQALTVGRLEAGQHVLVIGASGGVGSFAVQLAKARGATVTGVAGTRKLEVVRGLGADHVIDTGGRNPISRIRRALTPTGTLVIVGGEGGDDLTGGIGRQVLAALMSPFVRQRLTFFVSSESRDLLESLAEHLVTGAVTPALGRRFALEDVSEALTAMESGDLVGKAVITVTR
ncbi:NAD(P)-dependent alcohol dehydrogenase [Phycicoccus avicenniae]|nr:NAD(P)-dependent alcohol dehydrogenase [Phycicoccus avicenniae]